MKKPFYLLFTLLVLLQFSCSQSPKETNNGVGDIEKDTVEKVNELDILLTQTNLVEKLTKFGVENPDSIVLLKTPFGEMKLRLYSETPLHRANFLRLIKRGYYDNRLFHRVVTGFVAQAGGTDVRLPIKIGRYRIPAEIMPEKYFHKKGALAMARYDEDNPEKQSDSHEFYLIGGEPQTLAEINATAKQYGIKIPSAQKRVYQKIGGAPHLDGNYTVFGEVIEGLDVMEKIIALPADKRGFPKGDNITIDLKILKE
ncbi:MAG: cyclophilin family peptidyl-prolyl cis-trans isomerase [Arenicella sp.]